MKSFAHGVEEVLKIMELSRQHWLLGAGASVMSGVPLMYPLTARVQACLVSQDLDIFGRILNDLPANAHVEHVLSHLGDLIALAMRSKSQSARIGDFDATLANLKDTYGAIIKAIATTVRHGYRAVNGSEPEQIGTLTSPLIEVELHRRFVAQLFRGRANLEARSKVGFITTNYDTLLEDALAMEQRIALDGFAGGAIAFWNGRNIDPEHSDDPKSHRVLKLHGSVDWYQDPQAGLLRARYGVKYLADLSGTLIYPQSTKYVETQKDPFARIFDCFRRSLRASDNHLLGIVGYSFGDDHINDEIENALAHHANKTVVVAFSKEIQTPAGTGDTELCPTLRRWTMDPRFGSRIYVATDTALYNGNTRVIPDPPQPLTWWTFAGLTQFIEHGVAP